MVCHRPYPAGMVQLFDTLDAAPTARICADGSLVAEVYAARTGLQDYLGREVDPDNEHGLRDKAIVKVYRPPSEVFKMDSLGTFSGAPITLDHPPEPVTADNWLKYGRGEIHGDIVPDGQRVRVPIIVRDAATVRAATTTHKQLSMGYATELVFPADGKHPDGTACDAYQTNPRINHIALVRAARGGPELRVVDERPTRPSTGDLPMKTLTIDGLKVPNVSDEAEAAINKLQAENGTLKAKVADAETQVATLTTEKSTLDAKVTTLEQQVKDAKLSPEQLRDAAKAYAQVVDKAKALGVTVADTDSTDAIMKAVVSAKIGDAAKDWTSDQIAASFATLTKDVNATDTTVVNLTPARATNDGAADVRNLARAAQY